MVEKPSRTSGRDFVFEPTPAVAASRARSRYVDCAVCATDNSEYLFHRAGVRFVRCKTCELVYVSPVGEAGRNYFDIARIGSHVAPEDLDNLVSDFASFLKVVSETFLRSEGRPAQKTLLLGRYHEAFGRLEESRAIGLEILPIDDQEFASFVEGTDLRWLERRLEGQKPDIVLLDEFIEATGAPGAALELLTKRLPPSTWYVVTYANTQSLPAIALRRYWPHFFDLKRAYFSANNVMALMARYGLAMNAQFPYPTHVTLRYGLERAMTLARSTSALAKVARHISLPVRTGTRVAIFRRSHAEQSTKEKLSIVFPCFNEGRYVADVIEAILKKPLPIERELIIVESNSTDGTRDIVKSFEGREGVRVLLEDKPQGKGHAVRTGLAAVTGSIILIQDADFEYDIDDYDALLAPILQHRTSFVLGSRSLGLDDWKVRRFEGTPAKRLMLNAAQVGFAKTFNLLYQQNATDVNTMYKVFRTECLEGIELEGDRFELDIELVCKLVRNGYAPLEVPVNYVARGFEEGKKISFVKDALPSYLAFFKYRFRS